MAGIPPPPGGDPGLRKHPGYNNRSTTGGSQPPVRPPQRKPLPPSFRAHNPGKYRRRSSCSCGRCFCCTILVLLIILFVLALAGLVSYLYFQPKVPSFHLQSQKVGQFRISVKPESTFLDASVNATVQADLGGAFVLIIDSDPHMQATNPNGSIKYSYKQGEVTFSALDDDGDVSLGSGTFPGFQQGTDNSTVLKVNGGVKGVMMDDTVGTRFKSRYQSKELKFMVEIRTKIGIHVFNKITATLPAKIVCGAVSLKRIENGAPPRCSIYLLGWINLH